MEHGRGLCVWRIENKTMNDRFSRSCISFARVKKQLNFQKKTLRKFSHLLEFSAAHPIYLPK